MYKNILIPTDGSDLSEKAVNHGVLLAKALDATLTFVTVRKPFHSLGLGGEPVMVVKMPDAYKGYVHDYLTAESSERLAAAKSVAEQEGRDCETVDVENDQIYQGILDIAAERKCDLIVMASHGRRGISAVVLGSETVKVLTHSKVPVLVYR